MTITQPRKLYNIKIHVLYVYIYTVIKSGCFLSRIRCRLILSTDIPPLLIFRYQTLSSQTLHRTRQLQAENSN